MASQTDSPDFAHRRAALVAAACESIGVEPRDIAILLFSPPEVMRNSDVDYPFRADSSLYWLTGFSEPSVSLVLTPEHPDGDSTLFLRPRDPVREIWDGRRLGVDGAPSALGVARSREQKHLAGDLPALLFDRPHVFTLLDRDAASQSLVLNALTKVRQNSRRHGRHPRALHDLGIALHPLRLKKDAADVTALAHAVDVSAQGHLQAMRRAVPGMNERQLEAELVHSFAYSLAPRQGYSPIVAGGSNACILHYVENDAPIQDGDLVLIDAGAEVSMLSGDITRTWPINGTFSNAQRDVYDVVLAANLASIEAVAPGTSFPEIDAISRRVLAKGLVDLGLLAGEIDFLVEKVRADDDPIWAAGKAPLDRFYPHSTSHWLGLDVHDVGAYHDGSNPTRLAPGMALTVEPGLYLDGDGVAPELRGIGIRIEDDVLVTADGPRVLSAGVPKDPKELESIIGADRERT